MIIQITHSKATHTDFGAFTNVTTKRLLSVAGVFMALLLFIAKMRLVHLFHLFGGGFVQWKVSALILDFCE